MSALVKKNVKLDKRWAFAALVMFIAMLVVNWLGGSTSVLGGQDTGAVSDSYPNLFAPAGVTFAIWGLIYLLLGLFFFRVFEIWKPKKSELKNNHLNKILILFTVSSILNGLWVLAWHYNHILVSVLLMLGLLVSLVAIQQTLVKLNLEPKEYALVRLPFSVYLGWITVATIANITTWLVSFDWHAFGLSDGTWLVAVLMFGAVLAIYKSIRYQDLAYLMVVTWAYAGILLKHVSEGGHNGAYPSAIITLAILLSVFISVGIQIAQNLAREFKK